LALNLPQDRLIGILIHLRHVHKALRRYLWIESSSITQLFPFNNTEDFDFFFGGVVSAGGPTNISNSLFGTAFLSHHYFLLELTMS